MKRGGIWVTSRFGHERTWVVVGHEKVTATRPGVLVVPISDVLVSNLVRPTVSDAAGGNLGVANVPGIGEVNKAGFKAQVGMLAPTSVEYMNIALRAALDL